MVLKRFAFGTMFSKKCVASIFSELLPAQIRLLTDGVGEVAAVSNVTFGDSRTFLHHFHSIRGIKKNERSSRLNEHAVSTKCSFSNFIVITKRRNALF